MLADQGWFNSQPLWSFSVLLDENILHEMPQFDSGTFPLYRDGTFESFMLNKESVSGGWSYFRIWVGEKLGGTQRTASNNCLRSHRTFLMQESFLSAESD